MKRFFLSISLLCTITAVLISETEEDRNSKGYEYIINNDLENAEKFFLHAIEEYENEEPKDYDLIEGACNSLGAMYARTERHNEAIIYFKKALDILLKDENTNTIKIVFLYYNISMCYYSKDQINEEKIYLDKAVSYEEKVMQKVLKKDEDSKGTITAIGEVEEEFDIYYIFGECYHYLAEMSFQADDYKNTARYAKCALDYFEKTKHSDPERIIVNHYWYGMASYYLQDFITAEEYLLYTLKDLQEMKSNNLYRYLELYQLLSSIYMMYEIHEELKTYTKLGIECINAIGIEDNADLKNNYIVFLYRYGMACLHLEEYEEAITSFETIIANEKTIEEMNAYGILGDAYNNIGLIYQVTEDYDKVLDYYLKGLSVYEKMNPPSPQAFGIAFYNIGYFYETVKKDNKNAVIYYKKAQQEYTKAGNTVMVQQLTEMIAELSK